MTTDGERSGARSGRQFGLGRWRWVVVEVMGESMLPALRPGQRLVARVSKDVEPGDVLVFRRPIDSDPAGGTRGSSQSASQANREGHVLIKRAIRWDDEAQGWWVEGDNAAVSTDSRRFGAVRPDLIIARRRESRPR